MKINASFHLSEWTHLEHWQLKSDQLREMMMDLFKSDNHFKTYYEAFKKFPSKEIIVDTITANPKSLLPYCFLIQSDKRFYYAYFDEQILDFLTQNPLTIREFRLVTSAIISNYSDDLNFQQGLEKLCLSNREKFDSEENFSKYLEIMRASGLTSVNPISLFSEYCFVHKKNPDSILQKLKIRLSTQSDFMVSVEKEIVIKKLTTQDYRKESELINDIKRRDMFNWKGLEDELFGHRLIRTIISGFSMVNIHESWLKLIIDVAGDPRSSRFSPKYQKWWTRIEAELIKRFTKILSHDDILIFLDSIIEFAEQKNPTMHRMFKSRRKLLYGLSLQNIFEESRLFLPESLIDHLRKEKPMLNLEFVGRLYGSSDKALIYLKTGSLEIIEGSHNCKIRVFSNSIPEDDILNPNKINWNYGDLTTGMSFKYRYKYFEYPFSASHDQNGYWKNSTIKFLKKYHEFNHRELLTDRELNYFRP